MNLKVKHTYFTLIIVFLVLGCKQTKYVPNGKYLLKKNVIHVTGGKIPNDDVQDFIRQKPNYKNLGFKIRLFLYNQIDSAHVSAKRMNENLKLRKINALRIDKQKTINNRRIQKAQKKHRKFYTEKVIPLKDTVLPKMFLREWIKYKLGEKPVVFDSIPFNKTNEQLSLFLKNKGYYYAEISSEVSYRKHRKAVVTYAIKTGPQFVIDSVYVISDNKLVEKKYQDFLAVNQNANLKGTAFDKNYLDNYRGRVAKYMRDNELYGFSSSNISFVADTITSGRKGVILGIQFLDRQIRSLDNTDSVYLVKHNLTRVRNVYFHICDTSFYNGNFKLKMDELGIKVVDQNFIRTLDTLLYTRRLNKHTLLIDSTRTAVFLYNGKLSIHPEILEIQNYLEKNNPYRESSLERSYSRLLQLDLFQVIKPVLVEIPGTNLIDVHYYMVPSKRQSPGFETRATNSNGFLGVSASVNYTNRNLFGGAEKMILSISGGFESQPPIFEETLDGKKIKNAGRSFNTLEIGPSIKFDLPGLFPIKATAFSKRERPRTIIYGAYNYQKRTDFQRQIFQLNYLWKFYFGKTQIFQMGLPGLSVIKFVNIDKSTEFQTKINQLNDLFLKNSYSNQFVWQDWKFTFEYNNKDLKKSNHTFYLNSTFDPAGKTLSLFKKFQDTLSNGQHTFYGVGYSQFIRFDNDMIVSNLLGKNKSIHARFQVGGGIPYGNSKTSLPYDYSFFGGGSNDNRGWRARALGPGSYKYYLDTNRTATQIGDLRIAGSAEFRFAFGPLLKGAFFMDAGNIWTVNEDKNRVGSKISSNWYREIALSSGVGFRFDLNFFIIRLDFGVPITNPALPYGARWIFQSREKYYQEGLNAFGVNYKEYLPKPFTPHIHFGIGYPF
jgi:outer membrane protein insertion porin family